MLVLQEAGLRECTELCRRLLPSGCLDCSRDGRVPLWRWSCGLTFISLPPGRTAAVTVLKATWSSVWNVGFGRADHPIRWHCGSQNGSIRQTCRPAFRLRDAPGAVFGLESGSRDSQMACAAMARALIARTPPG